jgi:hypothetical protein
MKMNRLGERLIQTPGVQERYHEIVRGPLATNFNATALFPLMDAMAGTIRSSLLHDSLVSLPQFDGALSELSQPEVLSGANAKQAESPSGGTKEPGGPQRSLLALKAFINQRVALALLQLAGKTNGFMPRQMMSGPNNGPKPGGPPPRSLK